MRSYQIRLKALAAYGFIEVLMALEAKLDDNLSSRNFTSHRLDRNSNADKLMLFVRKDIPLKPVEVIKQPLCYKNQSHRTRIE